MPIAHPAAKLKREKGQVNPDRTQVPPQVGEPPVDEWTSLKQRYVQPVFDMLDTFKGGYDSLLNALGSPASPRRRK